MQYAVSIRDAQNNAIETDVGVSPIMRVYNGTAPANVAAALSGNTLLAEGTLPSDWMAASSAGVKGKAGTWTLTGQTGASTGTAGTFFRIYASDGTTAKIQGTFGVGQEAVPDNNNIADGQTVTINTFNITRGNG
ncbi:hypothetical protein [Hydrogenophaga sp.]|uniref:hypothetical protein n=1 Tax=Hydrogenophaga sp. TaxID=1904254 RepID=UPI003F71A64E